MEHRMVPGLDAAPAAESGCGWGLPPPHARLHFPVSPGSLPPTRPPILLFLFVTVALLPKPAPILTAGGAGGGS